MGRFDQVGPAVVSAGSGRFLKEGRYGVKIQAVKWVESRRNDDRFWVIEFVVEESSNPDVEVGGTYSQLIKWDKIMGPINVKAFVCAVSGVDAVRDEASDAVEEYWSSMYGSALDFSSICDFLCSTDNPLSDERMVVECSETTTQSGRPFTKHVWQPREVH